jgi:sulfur carrier protein ThiS
MPAPLGAFFEIWGESFDDQEIMGHIADDEHEVVLTVNGEVNLLFEEYIMEDGDIIEIEYRQK